MRQLQHDGPSRFSKWLRDTDNHPWRPEEDNLRAYDIDWIVWKKDGHDTGDGYFMMIEEKVKFAKMQHDQCLMYYKLDKIMKPNSYYMGFHILQFENFTPDDGDIMIDGKFTTLKDFITFWQFGAPDIKYKSWFDLLNENGSHWKQYV